MKGTNMPSNSKSWFTQATSSNFRLSNSSHELPRWRATSPSASIIPPPIVQSQHDLPRDPVAESKSIERPSPYEERQHELEADLQFLLDAQAEGLIRGLGGASLDDRSSTGSTTPTAQSIRSASTRKPRKPVRRQPGLRSSRKGIYNAIQALSTLKDEEVQDIDAQLEEHQNTLEQISDWEEKRQKLQEASKDADSMGETVRVQRLKQEADALQVEINAVELQLMEMKSRQRKLLKQAAAVDNSVQAKISSYTSSLKLLEEEIQQFLSVDPDADRQRRYPSSKGSMWRLPANRRNLDMAKEYWTEQHESTIELRHKHELEKVALNDGATLWKEVVHEVTLLEKRLQAEVSALRPSSPDSHSAWEDPPAADTDNRNGQLRETLADMETTITSLQAKLKIAEDNGWRLLIAAVGAELDALQRGKEILSNVLGIVDENIVAANGHDAADHEPARRDSSDSIHALDRSFQATRPASEGSTQHEDDHDEPDPELLFSRQDID